MCNATSHYNEMQKMYEGKIASDIFMISKNCGESTPAFLDMVLS